jgi:triosephosphate isomerase
MIAANWKMNGLREPGVALAAEVAARLADTIADGPEIVLCPPATLLFPVGEALAGSGVRLGAQDCHASSAGAFTGSIAAPMLVDAGCSHVILGHSERRSLSGETDGIVRAKASAALAHGLIALVCVGETEAERKSGQAFDVVGGQLAGSLPAASAPETLVIAYEPIWAIGTGQVASPAEIEEMHRFIRGLLTQRIPRGSAVRILYGGSVKPANAAEILGIADVDGALVGGASLVAAEFAAIATAGAPGRCDGLLPGRD